MIDIKITPLIETLRLEKISDNEYFSERYKNFISNSRLSLIDPRKDGSPDKFFSGFKSSFNPSFILGSAVHELVLQPEFFDLADDLGRPSAKLGAVADELYSIAKDRKPTEEEVIKAATKIDYYSGCLTAKKLDELYDKCFPYWDARKHFESVYIEDKELIYLDSKSRETVLNCVKALKNNKYVNKILNPKNEFGEIYIENERAILLDIQAEVPELEAKFILRLKSKLDNYTIDTLEEKICVNDIKTIGKVVSEAHNNITKFSYNRELAMYSWLLSLCAKKFYNINNPTIKGNYLFVSTIPSYYTKVIPMTKKMFAEGFNEFKYLLKLVAYHVATDYKDFAYKWI